MITNLLQSFVIFCYSFMTQQSIFILYSIVFAYSTLNQFYVPAEASYLPSTISKKSLSLANSLFFITIQVSIILGFGFAGIIQTFVGLRGAVVLCGALLFLAFVSTSLLPETKIVKKVSGDFEKTLRTFFDSVLEGYDFIKNNKGILFPLLLLLGLQASMSIIVVSLPVIATQIMNIAVTYVGVSVVVPAGVGATLGAMFIPRLVKKGARKKAIIETSLGVAAITLLILALGIPLLPVTLRILLTPFLIIMTGFSFVGINIPTLTYLQQATPEWLRGRVFGNLYFLVNIVSVFPVLFSGVITEIFGVRTMISIMAVGAGAVLVYAQRKGQILVKTEFSKVG